MKAKESKDEKIKRLRHKADLYQKMAKMYNDKAIDAAQDRYRITIHRKYANAKHEKKDTRQRFLDLIVLNEKRKKAASIMVSASMAAARLEKKY